MRVGTVVFFTGMIQSLVFTIATAAALPASEAGAQAVQCAVELVDDRAIRLQTPADAVQMRQQLSQYIWGQTSPPSDSTVVVTTDVPSPIGCSTNVLARVDHLRIDMPTGSGQQTYIGHAWHYQPSAQGSALRNRLVIVHNGHMEGPQACKDSFADGEDAQWMNPGYAYMGMQMSINALLADGYDVLAVSMPMFVEGQCDATQHPALFWPHLAPANGSGMRYFLDPTLRALNYLLTQRTFEDVSMTGLSGGGWTTTVYAAVDTRIKHSFPVAGSIPLYLRMEPQSSAGALKTAGLFAAGGLAGAVPMSCPVNLGDAEQYISDMYSIAGYPELYALGAYGEGRTQVQILNRRDSCCFGQAQHYDPALFDSDLRDYERRVREAVLQLGEGEFRLRIDEASSIHQTSRDAVHGVILAELNHATPRFGAAGIGSVVVRGTRGSLWHYSRHGWVDTGFLISGSPAVLENAVHAIDVVARDDQNAPVHIFHDGVSWQSRPLPLSSGTAELARGSLIGDPMLVSAGQGQFDAVALAPRAGSVPGADLYHWHVTASGAELAKIGAATHAVGLPALALVGPDRLGVYVRDGSEIWLDPAPVPLSATACIVQPRGLSAHVQGTSGSWSTAQAMPQLGSLLSFPETADLGSVTALPFVNQAGEIWEARLGADGSQVWQLTKISHFADPVRFDGSASVASTGLFGYGVFARTSEGNLGSFLHNGGHAWNYQTVSLAATPEQTLADSPRAVGSGAIWTGRDRQLRYYDGNEVHVLDTLFVDGFND